MPGLLDYGQGDPTGAGLVALGAGLVRGDFGGGLLGFNQAMQEAQKNALTRQYMSAQMENMQSEVEARKAALARQQQIQALLSGALGPNTPSQPAMPGQLGSGSFGVVPPPAGQPSIPQPQGAPSGSRIGSLPLDTLALLKANGLDLVDVAKLGRPDMQVSNGYAYDKNHLAPGFLPQANVSQNGQATVMTVGADGMPRIAPVPGAVDAYSQFRNADEAAKAGLDLVKVVGPDGAERYVTRAQAAQATQPPAPRAPLPMGPRPMASSPADADRYAILTQELARAQASGNQGDVAALQREIASLPASARTGASPSGLATMPLQASPTFQQAAQAAAEKERQTQIAKDITEQRKTIMNADFAAPTNIAKMQKIGQLLSGVDGGRYTPNGTEVASALNSLGIKIDKNLGNKQAAAAMANEMALQLRSPQGGAGMPGALSDKDREFLASMTPNQAQSLEGRTQVINAYVAVQQRNQQVAQFARNYEKKYGKLDNGFFDQMAAWSAAHPLFGGK